MKKIRIPYLIRESNEYDKRFSIDYTKLSYYSLQVDLYDIFEEELMNSGITQIEDAIYDRIDEFWKDKVYQYQDFIDYIDSRIVLEPTNDPNKIYLKQYSVKPTSVGERLLEYDEFMMDASIRMHTWILLGFNIYETSSGNRYAFNYKKNILNDHDPEIADLSNPFKDVSGKINSILNKTAKGINFNSNPLDMLMLAYQWVYEGHIKDYNKSTDYYLLKLAKKNYCPKKSIEEIEQFMLDLPIREAGRLDALVAWCDEHDKERNLLDIF